MRRSSIKMRVETEGVEQDSYILRLLKDWRFGMNPVRMIAAILIVFAFFAPSMSGNASTEASEPNLKIGNCWVYSFDISEDWWFINGTVTMEIDEVNETFVGGVAQEVFVVRSTGEADISGWCEGTEVTGSFTIDARELRLCSNFDMVWSTVWTDMSYTYMGIPLSTGAGYDMRFAPTFDDYVGDDDLVVGTKIAGVSHVTGDTWEETFGTREYDVVDGDVEYTLDITETNVTKSTTAGTFSCCKVRFASSSDNGYSSGTNYYSEEVGNYVTMEAGSAYYNGMLGDLKLVSYSYNPDGVLPVADAGEDITADAWDVFALNGTASYDNVGIVNYTWELTRDGNNTYLYGPEPELVLEAKGEYIIYLIVYDEAGNWDNDSVAVTIRDEGMLAYLSADGIWVGLIALVAIALVLFFALKGRKGGMAPTSMEEAPAGEQEAHSEGFPS